MEIQFATNTPAYYTVAFDGKGDINLDSKRLTQLDHKRLKEAPTVMIARGVPGVFVKNIPSIPRVEQEYAFVEVENQYVNLGGHNAHPGTDFLLVNQAHIHSKIKTQIVEHNGEFLVKINSSVITCSTKKQATRRLAIAEKYIESLPHTIGFWGGDVLNAVFYIERIQRHIPEIEKAKNFFIAQKKNENLEEWKRAIATYVAATLHPFWMGETKFTEHSYKAGMPQSSKIELNSEQREKVMPLDRFDPEKLAVLVFVAMHDF